MNYNLIIEEICGGSSCLQPTHINNVVSAINQNFQAQLQSGGAFQTLLTQNVNSSCCAGCCTNSITQAAFVFPPIVASDVVVQIATSSPTSAPTNPAAAPPPTAAIAAGLPFVGGCPSEYKDSVLEFTPGDRVSKDAIVFECKSFPASLFCAQSAFRPDLKDTTTMYWKEAWEVVGYCSGTILPSTSTTATIIGCPATWTSGDVYTKYKGNDRVSVIKSTTPLIQVVFKCKEWPDSMYCGQFNPLSASGGKLGWEYIGECTGTMGPTASPTYSPGTAVINGCPDNYNPAKTDYTPGSQILSNGVVYECRAYPNSGYCNQKGFAPGGQYDYMAWTRVGPCDGTLAPTTAPTPYGQGGATTPCTYTKMITSTISSVTTTTPVTTPVGTWTASTLYEAGDQVRIGATKFQCKPWPFFTWCRMSAYKPTLSASGLWTEAWTLAGTCP